MTDAIHEQLSAFLDGELSAAESELLLKRIERDPTLKEQLERYVLAGEALRATHVEVRPSRDFSTRVARAIDGDSSLQLPARARQAAHWLKPVAGGAIAAGVAAVALVSFQVAPTVAVNVSPADMSSAMAAASNGVAQAIPAELAAPAGIAAPIGNGGSASYTVPPASDPRMAPPIRVINNSRLANYVVAHSEYSSPLARRNVLTGLVAEEVPEGQSGDQVAETFIVEPFVVEKWTVDEPAQPPVANGAGNDAMLSRGPR